MAYRLKQEDKEVTYNDLLRFNYYFGLALIENDDLILGKDDLLWIMQRHDDLDYPTFVQDTFKEIYFTDEENVWIDQTITNIQRIENPFCYALAFFALAQACIVKRPYNLFHRKNLYMRFAPVKRGFGNKASWDKPFPDWFNTFINEANRSVFPGAYPCKALNLDAVHVPGEFDLVYIDPPYISERGAVVDYADFYHFLQGLCFYDKWPELIDWKSKHRRMVKKPNAWTDKKRIYQAFSELFDRFSRSILVVSYRSDGIPSIEELHAILKRHKTEVRIDTYGQYKYVLSQNSRSREVLLIGK